jgi:hypothetical protein
MTTTGNEAIDDHDVIFSELHLWQDVNHDGVSQPWELHTLADLGIAGISLVYAEAWEVDHHENSFRYWAAVYGTPGSPVGMTAWDVWLVGVRPAPAVDKRSTLDDTEPRGNPREHERCYRAADGDQDSWLDYCNTIPPRLRKSCRNIAPDNSQVKRGRCDEYWGSILTCTE